MARHARTRVQRELDSLCLQFWDRLTPSGRRGRPRDLVGVKLELCLGQVRVGTVSLHLARLADAIRGTDHVNERDAARQALYVCRRLCYRALDREVLSLLDESRRRLNPKKRGRKPVTIPEDLGILATQLAETVQQRMKDAGRSRRRRQTELRRIVASLGMRVDVDDLLTLEPKAIGQKVASRRYGIANHRKIKAKNPSRNSAH